MKAQPEITTRSGNKSREYNQFHKAATRPQIPPPSSQPVLPQYEFTIEEHRGVQQEIEERAHHFWFTSGSALSNALNDWLQAENEVLMAFVKTRKQRRLVTPNRSKTKTKTGGTSVLAPTIFNQAAALSKLRSTAAFHQS